jgi:hypothetical protein
MLRRVVWQKFNDVSEMLTASIIALMMKAVNISEKSVDLYQTTLFSIP